MNHVSRWTTSLGGVGLLVLLLVAGGCGSDGDSGGVAPDTDAPVITSAPTVSNVTESSATISWSTDEAATSLVRYGTTPSYGSSEGSSGSQGSSSYTTSHSVTITGLDAYTEYHFSVEVADEAGNSTSTSDAMFTTDLTFAMYMDQGWTAWEAGDYALASSSFSAAAAKDASSVEARMAQGWADLYQVDFTSSIGSFDAALALDATDLDAKAGRAFASVENGTYLQAILDATQVLAGSSTYSFSHLSGYNYLDLHAIMAVAHYSLADYASAEAEVDILDPMNGLDSGEPGYLSELESAVMRLYYLLVYEDPGQAGGKTPTSPITQG